MLNAILTVQARLPRSHKYRGWEKFTDAVINVVNTKTKNVAYILWGDYARKKGKEIDINNNKIIEGTHPSPMAEKHAKIKFLDVDYFKPTNIYLIHNGKQPIDWSKLD